ncbi:hypothetical protein V6N13_021892 [Hibiscus sabdariffa]
MIEEAMLEFSSFERGRVLIETTVIDRIEERLELSVSGHVFSIRILEADTLLRGPRGYYSMRDQSSSSEDLVSDKEEEQIDQKDGQSCAHEGVASAMRVDEQLADGAEECDEPILEGSNAEVIISNGHKRKVQLLTDVIHSLQSLEGEVTSDEGDSMAGSWASSVVETFHYDDSALDVPLCCGCDINAVLYLEERRHCVGDKRGMAGFASFVEDVGLLDLSALGKAFTWFGTGLKGHVKLMESEWRMISEKVVSPLSIIEKLLLLKVFLKVWNRESYGSVDLQIEVTTDLLNHLEEQDGGVEERELVGLVVMKG